MGRTYKDRKDTRPEVLDWKAKTGRHPTRDEAPKATRPSERSKRQPPLVKQVAQMGTDFLDWMERGKAKK